MNFPPRGQYLKGMWGRRIGWFGGEGSLNGSTDQPFCQAKLRHHPAGRPPVALHPLPRPAVVCSWGDRQHLRWRSPDAKGNPPGARISDMHLLSWSRIDPVCRTNETKKKCQSGSIDLTNSDSDSRKSSDLYCQSQWTLPQWKQTYVPMRRVVAR